MGDKWDIPDDKKILGDKQFYVKTGGEKPGIYVTRDCDGESKEELILPKETLIEAWYEFIPCLNKVKC